jgi:NAD(P)-dependent dehydrogenase (short-subunit alcohol dehydrogenase family)
MNLAEKNLSPQSTRRVLITGANSGIGFQTALELARHGAEIILPARTEVKSNDAINRIQSEVPNAKLTSAVLDLASLASIRSFAKFYVERFPGQSLDLLINNAGVMAVPTRELTIDGYERQFVTNYLGPFALTALLFPHMKPQFGTRIVTISSLSALNSNIDFDNLQSERSYQPISGAYAQSKLADLIFMFELQRRLSENKSPIISTGAHPGVAITNLQSNLIGFPKMLGSVIYPLISQNATQGALPTLFAATSPDVVPGGYYGPNGSFEIKGFPVPAKIPPQALNVNVAQRLWTESEQLTGITFNLTTQIAK